ncbi:MAG TPA: TetR/AcrR family transcriptional regulator [Baekduia sp.]
MSTPTSTGGRGPRIPKAEARERIRAAAARLLVAGSYRDLSVDSVMAEAGLARTLFYRHFDALGALVLSLLDDLRAGLVESGEPGDPAYLRRVLEHTVEVFRTNGPILRAIDDAARHDAEVERAYRGFLDWSIDLTVSIFEDAIAAGRVRTVPDVRATVHALNVMNGAFLMDMFGRDPDADADPALCVDVLWTIWARTLGID